MGLKLDAELLQKIKKKKTDDLESLWQAKAGAAPLDRDWFEGVAAEMRAAKLQGPMVDWILESAETVAADDRWEDAFSLIRVGIVQMPRLKEFRTKMLELVQQRYENRSDLADILAKFDLLESEEPLKAFDALRGWLRYDIGSGFWLFGRGLGKVSEANLGLSKIQIRFEKAAPLTMRTDEASKLLTWIPDSHFMMRRLKEAEEVKAEAKADPGAFMRELLTTFGRSLTSAEIKECMGGVLEGSAWTSWWNKAKSHPQVLPDKQKRNAYMWSDSAESVEDQLFEEFERGGIADRVEFAKKYAKRGGSLVEKVTTGLVAELESVASLGGSEAVDLYCMLEDLGGLPKPSPLNLEELLAGEDAAEIVAEVSDRRWRERLWKQLRKAQPEQWAMSYRVAFLSESDLRNMSHLYEAVTEDGPDDLSRKMVAESVTSLRKYPRAFVWVVKNVLKREELATRANLSLLQKVCDALESVEFKELKAPLREQFEEGGLSFAVFEGADYDGADRLLNLVDSANALEDHRKTAIRRAIFRKYPKIRKRGDDDIIYVTAEATEEKRKEFEELVKVEIPQNAEAIRVAREYGDLRENFEYHAARQKHEVLNARAARLSEDLNKARLIDPNKVDGSRIAIGATFRLTPLAGGDPRNVTILGPWESDPDSGVYSYQSEFAKELVGSGDGDEVSLDGVEYRVSNIRPWQPAGGPVASGKAG